jgi:hypothetical protein
VARLVIITKGVSASTRELGNEAGTEHVAVGGNLRVIPIAGGEPAPADRSQK